MPLQRDMQRSARVSVFLLFAEALIIVYLTVNAVVAPIYRPLQRWFSKLEFVIRLQDRIAELPPYGILVLLGSSLSQSRSPPSFGRSFSSPLAMNWSARRYSSSPISSALS